MFEALALSGGGVRGGLLVGGLAALETLRGNLTFPQGIYGCSIGSILATAVAFNLSASAVRSMFEDDFQLSRAIPSLRLSNITDFPKTKGMFSMDMFRDLLIQSFQTHGIDVTAPISNAPQPLYILASNLTTRKPTFLTGDVPILDAILASCCLPFIFAPRVLYNNVYVDGGIFVPNFHTIVPEHCLILHIDRPNKPFFPSDIESTSVRDMFTQIYMGKTKIWPSNVVIFENETIQILQELTADDKLLMYTEGQLFLTRFWAKRHTNEL